MNIACHRDLGVPIDIELHVNRNALVRALPFQYIASYLILYELAVHMLLPFSPSQKFATDGPFYHILLT